MLGFLLFLFGILIGFVGGIILFHFFPDRLRPLVTSLLNLFRKDNARDVEDAEFTVEEKSDKKSSSASRKPAAKPAKKSTTGSDSKEA